MKEFRITIGNRPGELARLAESLARHGVNIKAVTATATGAQVTLHLIGHDVEVTPAPRVPKAHRLVLGDHSKVQISS